MVPSRLCGPSAWMEWFVICARRECSRAELAGVDLSQRWSVIS